jgi:hypothetical protein
MAMTPRARRTKAWLVARARSVARIPWRRLLTIAGLIASFGLVVTGITLIYAPAGLIAGGLGLFALLTFDLAKAGRLTWPR